MSKTILHDGDDGVLLIVRDEKPKKAKKEIPVQISERTPVHVVYGGAHLFRSNTPKRLGDIALTTLESYSPNFCDLALAVGLPGSETLATRPRDVGSVERFYRTLPENLKTEDYPAWFAAAVYDRVKTKLQKEPVEDFRIDFEDGYGFRPDNEEDRDAAAAALELATAFREKSITAFCGLRVKSYSGLSRERAKRTLHIFLDTFFDAADHSIPENFVVTLPKVTEKKEVIDLCRDLRKLEKKAGINEGSIGIEIMVEHPLALIDRKGRFALRRLVEASKGRCRSAHFGAYDYTAGLGIAAPYQGLAHPSCEFARQLMLASLKPIGIRLSDSVTIQLPVAVHRGKDLTPEQAAANRASLNSGWKLHFDNIRRSMAAGFFQSWDLHPNQLVARYAAVYSFFLESANAQAGRLLSFLNRATKATLSGNAFDDAASAMGIVNFFRQGIDCGALSETEVETLTGLTGREVRINSFRDLVEINEPKVTL